MTTPRKYATPPPNGKRFPKGKSGNPGGLTPTQRKIKALCKEDADLAMVFIKTLVQDASATNRDRLAAAQYIYDQAYGKPRQALHHTGELTLTHEEALLALADDIELPGATTTH